MEPQINEPQSVVAPLKKITPLSKYLAMALFIILPFLGGWIGYGLAPEKVVEVEKILIQESKISSDEELDVPKVLDREMYTSPNGFTILVPTDALVTEEPSAVSSTTITNIKGSFGTLLISPEYAIGGKGAEGAKVDTTILTSQDGIEMNVTILKGSDNSVAMIVQSLKPLPLGFSDSAQIQVFTTEEKLPLAESILTSIRFLEQI